jgi:hypothetical protein
MQAQKCSIIDPRWDEAIADARRKISEVRGYIAQLRAAIKVFEKNKGNGVRWPKSKRTTKPLRQQHSV